MKEPLISIIVPIYNTEKYLCKCLDSIVSQTFNRLEIILVDDGSTDSSPKICDEYAGRDGRIKVLHKANGGNTSARKAGLAYASCRYVGFVDSDDWIEPNMYEELYHALTEKGTDMVSCGFFLERNGESLERFDYLEEGIHRPSENPDDFMKRILTGNPQNSENIYSYLWSKLIRKDIIQAGQQKIDDKITYIEDRALLYTCYYDTDSIYILKKPLYHYRFHTVSTINKTDEYTLAKLNDVYVYIKHLFQQHNASSELLKLNDYFLVSHVQGVLAINMGISVKRVVYPLPQAARNKKIVIYGAGRLGQEYYAQLKPFHCQGWMTDTNWNYLKEDNIISPEEALSKNYDYVVVAALKKETAHEIIKLLNEKKVPNEKIIWNTKTGDEWIYV